MEGESQNLPQPEPSAPPAPRGRPWVKGQSGNPRGRPSLAHGAAFVAQMLIDRKTVPLMRRLIAEALAGDKAALRLCVERLAPPRREAPAWLRVPAIENRRSLKAALTTIADAAAQGDISSAHGERLMRMLTRLYPYL